MKRTRVVCIWLFFIMLVFFCGACEKKKQSDTIEGKDSQFNSQTVDIESNTAEEEKGIRSTISLGDLDGNGIEEIINTEEDNPDLPKYFRWELCVNGESVYETDCYTRASFEPHFIDLDEDGENEILIFVYPNVNSASLTQYVVMKHVGDEWKELENTEWWTDDDRNEEDNSFPINVSWGEEKCILEINLEGYGSATVDVTKHYEKFQEEFSELKDESELYELAIDMLSSGRSSRYEGAGGDLDWGIGSMELTSFEGKNCLVASDFIAGPGGRWDVIGLVDVYFNYDVEGKINVLHAEFISDETSEVINFGESD